MGDGADTTRTVRVPLRSEAARAAESWYRRSDEHPHPIRWGWAQGRRVARFSDGSVIVGWGHNPRVHGRAPDGTRWDITL